MDRRFDTKGGAQVITCASCGAAAETGRSGGKAGGRLPPQAVARFFNHKGWHVGAKPRQDRCPDCLNPKRKDETELGKDAQIITINAPQPGASERPPREATREDRRLIFAKLEEVYIDERQGYSTGWNDQRVAQDMAVPRAWVEEIRDQNFGPQKADQSPEVVALTASINSFETDLELHGEAVRTAIRRAAQLTQEAGELVKQAAAVENRSEALQARLTSLRDELRKLTGTR